MGKREEWKKLREDGLSYQAIADKYGTSRQLVWQTLDGEGVPRKTKYSQYYEEWENLYRQGVSTNKIAEKYNIHARTIHKHLSKKFVIERGRLMKKRGTLKPPKEVDILLNT